VESVGYLILYVRDVDVSAAFYRDVVGLPSKLRDAGYVEFVTGGTRFGLLERTRASDLIHREPTEGGPAGEVLFLVDDVDAEAERLRALGVELLSGPVDLTEGRRRHLELRGLKGARPDRGVLVPTVTHITERIRLVRIGGLRRPREAAKMRT